MEYYGYLYVLYVLILKNECQVTSALTHRGHEVICAPPWIRIFEALGAFQGGSITTMNLAVEIRRLWQTTTADSDPHVFEWQQVGEYYSTNRSTRLITYRKA